MISPIDWEEPFGLMMIEAMACGTPVISTRRGAVPEIVDHGRTGVIVDRYRDMEDPAVLELADSLDPVVIRKEVEDRFSPEHMVANYVAAYEATIEARSRASKSRPYGWGEAVAVSLRSRYDREILGLALPALGALAAEPLYLLVDTAIVGHLGRPQLAALGIAITILGGTFAIFNFLQYGTTAQVARAGGAGEEETARQTRRTGGLALAGIRRRRLALLAVLAEPLVSLMGGDGQAAEYAVTYLRIAAIGFPAAFLALGAQGYLRGVADLRTPLVILIAGNVANVILELLFVYGFGWGVEGSAWGTAIAQLGMGVAFVVVVLRRLEPGEARVRLALARRVLSLGKWIFIRTTCAHGVVRARRRGRDALRRGLDRGAPGRVPALGLPRPRPRRGGDRGPDHRRARARCWTTRCRLRGKRADDLAVGRARRRLRGAHARACGCPAEGVHRRRFGARRGSAPVAALRAHAAAERSRLRARRDPHRRERRTVLAKSMVFAFLACAAVLLVTLEADWGIRGVWAALVVLIAVRLTLMATRFRRGRWLVTGWA